MKHNPSFIEEIQGYLSEEFEVEKEFMTPGANLREVLQLDSLDYIDLVVVIESNFAFKVKPEDFNQIISFADFYSYIISRGQSKEPTNAVVMAGQVQG